MSLVWQSVLLWICTGVLRIPTTSLRTGLGMTREFLQLLSLVWQSASPDPKAPLPKGGGHGEAVTGGFHSAQTRRKRAAIHPQVSLHQPPAGPPPFRQGRHIYHAKRTDQAVRPFLHNRFPTGFVTSLPSGSPGNGSPPRFAAGSNPRCPPPEAAAGSPSDPSCCE